MQTAPRTLEAVAAFVGGRKDPRITTGRYPHHTAGQST
jgi:hypothetical protein